MGIYYQTFTVEPIQIDNVFPIDLLRIDKCFPETEEDSYKIERSVKGLFVDWTNGITLGQFSISEETNPTKVRWEKRGWVIFFIKYSHKHSPLDTWRELDNYPPQKLKQMHEALIWMNQLSFFEGAFKPKSLSRFSGLCSQLNDLIEYQENPDKYTNVYSKLFTKPPLKKE